MKNWLLSSSIGCRMAELRARFVLCREWSARSERKKPAFNPSRTKPCVTRMPLTDSTRVAVTREKLSVVARACRLMRWRKWRLSFQITGASPSTTRKSTGSSQSISPAATAIWPNCTMETKNTSWIAERSASTSEVTRPSTRPSFVRWKNAMGWRCTLVKSSTRRRCTTVSPSSWAKRMRKWNMPSVISARPA